MFAQKPTEATVGSAYLVADDLVLTAGHVVLDAEKIEVRQLGEQDWVTASIAWSDRAERDAALLRVEGTRGRGEDHRPVRWGSLAGITEPISCTAAGFPWAQARTEGTREVRDTEQLIGQIAPLSKSKAGRYAIDVISSAPQEPSTGGSPWAGMSGAAVFAGQHLVGLVVVDPERFGPARLEAVPADVLVQDPEFTQLVSATGELAMSSVRPRQRYVLTPTFRSSFGHHFGQSRAGLTSPALPRSFSSPNMEWFRSWGGRLNSTS